MGTSTVDVAEDTVADHASVECNRSLIGFELKTHAVRYLHVSEFGGDGIHQLVEVLCAVFEQARDLELESVEPLLVTKGFAVAGVEARAQIVDGFLESTPAGTVVVTQGVRTLP